MQIVLGEKNLLSGCAPEEIINLQNDWSFWARPDQLPPKTDWTTWLVLGGRGAGKTRTGAEWIAAQVRAGVKRIALVGETYEDAREVMISGPSGLQSIGSAEDRPDYEVSRHRLVWPNGAEAHIFSADDPDGMRGFQFEAAWADEVCKWRRPEAAWSNLQLGLRLGERPRQVVTTTPRPMALLSTLMGRTSTEVSRASTYANRGHLAEAFFSEIASTYEGTRLGAQELLGELLEEQDGALWWPGLIDSTRVTAAPPLDRIVLAIDPPVTAGPDSDECGMIVAGIAGEGTEAAAYVLCDGSFGPAPAKEWAKRAAQMADEYQVDRVVAEVNQGGDLVEEMLRLANPNLPYRAVRAARGKVIRAEPIAALYEQRRVHHVGHFAALEQQLCGFTGSTRGASPDRLDALVWALTDLMLGRSTGRPTIRTL